VAALPAGGTVEGLVVHDIGRDVGFTEDVETHGASVGDLDGDGRDDLFLSGHGSRARIFLRGAGGYTQLPKELLRQVDRHSCALGDIDESGILDVVCATGAEGGGGIKSNELWLDPGTGADDDAAARRGITDPFGRGRIAMVFDADGDRDLDVYLTNSPLRYDGQASPSRLFRNDGAGRFTWDPASGLTNDRGAICLSHPDLDRDGDDDVVLCGRTQGVLRTGGLVVFRNDAGRFRNATSALGITPIGEVDAVVGQVGGTPDPDLVQLSQTRLRVSRWAPVRGRFVVVYERSLTGGRGLAMGDADGDGDADLYLQRGSAVDEPDLILLNAGHGAAWTTLDVPAVTKGVAEDVVPLQFDGDGRTDFLVLNGRKSEGPVQLITVKPTDPE